MTFLTSFIDYTSYAGSHAAFWLFFNFLQCVTGVILFLTVQLWKKQLQSHSAGSQPATHCMSFNNQHIPRTELSRRYDCLLACLGNVPLVQLQLESYSSLNKKINIGTGHIIMIH